MQTQLKLSKQKMSFISLSWYFKNKVQMVISNPDTIHRVNDLKLIAAK